MAYLKQYVQELFPGLEIGSQDQAVSLQCLQPVFLQSHKDFLTLIITLSYQHCFISYNVSILIELVAKDLSSSNASTIWWPFN